MPVAKLLALVMLVSIMLGAGLQFDRRRFLEVAHEYGLFAQAFLVNFVLLPAFALLMVRLAHISTDVAIGIVLMAMAPGVPFLVNLVGRPEGGSLHLALTITFSFAALSVVTVPITIEIITHAFPNASVPPIPIGQFLRTLVVGQLLPLVVGALLGPRLAAPMRERLVKLFHWLFIAAALVFLALLFPRIVSSFASVYGFGRLATIAAIGVFSLAAGWAFGGRNRQYRRTLSIAALMRNVGLCALVGSNAEFAGTLVMPTIFAYFVITFLIAQPLRIYYKRTASA